LDRNRGGKGEKEEEAKDSEEAERRKRRGRVAVALGVFWRVSASGLSGKEGKRGERRRLAAEAEAEGTPRHNPTGIGGRQAIKKDGSLAN